MKKINFPFSRNSTQANAPAAHHEGNTNKFLRPVVVVDGKRLGRFNCVFNKTQDIRACSLQSNTPNVGNIIEVDLQTAAKAAVQPQKNSFAQRLFSTPIQSRLSIFGEQKKGVNKIKSELGVSSQSAQLYFNILKKLNKTNCKSEVVNAFITDCKAMADSCGLSLDGPVAQHESLMSLLVTMPTLQRQHFMGQCQSLVADTAPAWFKTEVIDIVQATPVEQRDALIGQYENLATGVSFAQVKLDLLNMLNETPFQQRSEFVSQCEKMPKQVSSSELMIRFVKILHSTPVEQRAAFINQLEKITGEFEDDRYVSHLSHIFQNTSSDQREELIKSYQALCTHIAPTYDEDRVDFLKILHQVPLGQKGDFIKHCQQLCVGILGDQGKIDLVRRLGRISSEVRTERFIRQCEAMGSELRIGHDRAVLIEDLAEIEPSMRTDELIDQCKKICSGIQTGRKIGRIVETLSKTIPENEMREFAEQCLRLTSGVKAEKVKVDIICKLAEIPKTQRNQAFFKQCESYSAGISKDGSAMSRYLSLALALASPKHERLRNSDRIQSLMKQVVAWNNDEQFTILEEKLWNMDNIDGFIDFNNSMGKNGHLPSLLLWSTIEQDWSTMDQPTRTQLTHYFAQRELRDKQLMIPVVSFLIELSDENRIPKGEAQHLLLSVTKKPDDFSQKSKKNQLKSFIKETQFAETLVMLRSSSELQKNFNIFEFESSKDIRRSVIQGAHSLLKIPENEAGSSAINDYLNRTRHPGALLAYAGKHLESGAKVQEAIGRYAQQVIVDHTFSSQRYQTNANPHLAAVKNADPAVFDRWSGVDDAQKPQPLTASETETPALKSHAPWQVEITDDPEDLLLCGTEIQGSCQNVNNSAGLNRGLLGYLLDGKIKLLAVKKSEGNSNSLMARRLVRLLLDNQGKPVLHLDRLYSNPGLNRPQEKAMDQAIHQYSEWLGVDVVSSKDRARYPLQSLGGPAPFEYVDATDGLEHNGEYKITT